MNALHETRFWLKTIELNIRLIFLWLIYSLLGTLSFGDISVKYLKGINESMSSVEHGGNLTYGAIALNSGIVHKIRNRATDAVLKAGIKNFDDDNGISALLLITRALFPTFSLNIRAESDSQNDLINFIGLKQLANLINFLYDKQNKDRTISAICTSQPVHINLWNAIVDGIESVKSKKGNNAADDIFYCINQVILACAWNKIESLDMVRHFIDSLHSDFKNGIAYNPSSVWSTADLVALKCSTDPMDYAQYLAIKRELDVRRYEKNADEHFFENANNKLSFAKLIRYIIHFLTTKISYCDTCPDFSHLRWERSKHLPFQKILNFFQDSKQLKYDNKFVDSLVADNWIYVLNSACKSINMPSLTPNFLNLHNVLALILNKRQLGENYSENELVLNLNDIISTFATDTKKTHATLNGNNLAIKIFDTEMNRKFLLVVTISKDASCYFYSIEGDASFSNYKKDILQNTKGLQETMKQLFFSYSLNDHPIWTVFSAQLDTHIKRISLLMRFLDDDCSAYLPTVVADLINSVDWEAYIAEVRRVDAAEIFNKIIKSEYFNDERFVNNIKAWYIDGMFGVLQMECLSKFTNVEYIFINSWSCLKSFTPFIHLKKLARLVLWGCEELLSGEGSEFLQNVLVRRFSYVKLANVEDVVLPRKMNI